MSGLHAGTGRRLINPELGMRGPGIRIFCDPLVHIESDLTVTALVLEAQGRKLAVLGYDLAVVPFTLADEVRAVVAKAVGTAPSCVLLNFSHTHASPVFKGWPMSDDPEQVAAGDRYYARLVEAGEQAAVDADRARRPARIAAGWGEAPVGVYRRERGADDAFILGEVPDAAIDPAVGVIRVDDVSGRPIAVGFSYGCHPVIVGPRTQAVSSDYPGAARKVVEDVLGGTALFLQACGGNVNPRHGIGIDFDCTDVKEREGTLLASAVIGAASRLRTDMRRGPRTLYGDLGIAFWPWLLVDVGGPPAMGAVERRVVLPLTDLPTLDVAARLRDHHAAERASATARRARSGDISVAERWAQWADVLHRACSLGEGTLETPSGTFAIRGRKATIEVGVQGLRVGDVALIATPFEMFFETGMAIKTRSPIAHTEVLGYSNGTAGYLPRAQDYPRGGWSVEARYAVPDLFPQSWLWPVVIHPDAEGMVVEAAVGVLEDLARTELG
jgi:hypothetical protein